MFNYFLSVSLTLSAYSAGAQAVVHQCPVTTVDAETFIAQVARKQGKDLSPFELLFVRDNTARMKQRLDRGFDINSCGGPFDSSLLGAAAALGLKSDVQLALAQGAELERPLSARGESALIQALSNNRFDVAQLLISAGADVHSTYGAAYQYNALDAISMAMNDPKLDSRKQLEVAQYLLQKGVSPNRKDLNPSLGMTPLIKAVIYDKPALVELFLKYDADPRLTANNGKSAIDYAQSMKRTEILRMLQTGQ